MSNPDFDWSSRPCMMDFTAVQAERPIDYWWEGSELFDSILMNSLFDEIVDGERWGSSSVTPTLLCDEGILNPKSSEVIFDSTFGVLDSILVIADSTVGISDSSLVVFDLGQGNSELPLLISESVDLCMTDVYWADDTLVSDSSVLKYLYPGLCMFDGFSDEGLWTSDVNTLSPNLCMSDLNRVVGSTYSSDNSGDIGGYGTSDP